MSQSVLIVYTTKYGSTHQVALAVTSTLQEVGFEVEFKPAKAVEELGSLDLLFQNVSDRDLGNRGMKSFH